MNEGELMGWRVLVTRPADQSAPLINMIESRGGRAQAMPLLVIQPARDIGAVQRVISQLARYQWIIFISANAVYQGWPFFQVVGGMPSSTKIAAVGKATANAIYSQGGHVDLIPETDFSSDGLLATAPMQSVQGQSILIVRGEGGKETLASTLRARGAMVVYAEVYRRDMAQQNLVGLCDAKGTPQIDVIATSSGEALQHLANLAHSQNQLWIFNLPLIVVHSRHIAVAKTAGFTHTPFVADNAADDAVMAALIRAREQFHE